MVIHYSMSECYLGWLLVATTEKGICLVAFDDTPKTLAERLESCFPQTTRILDDTALQATLKQTIAYMKRPGNEFPLTLDISGTPFQPQVWDALQKIHPGTTVTYSELAKSIGKPKAIRAVASACAANKIAVIIPCHRVIRSDGGLGGYRWGLERKQALLALEADQT